MASSSSERDSDRAEDIDPFAALLSLEDQYYTEGYTLGVTDGSRAGRIEGRVFGLEKGYEKFAQMGRLGGKAGVWRARLSSGESHGEPAVDALQVRLAGSERLRKHVDRLAELTEADSLETKNTEEAVSEFDERLAGAKAKAMLIGKIVGEDGSQSTIKRGQPGAVSNEVEVTRPGSSRRRDNAGGDKSGEMEDFTGLPELQPKTV